MQLLLPLLLVLPLLLLLLLLQLLHLLLQLLVLQYCLSGSPRRQGLAQKRHNDVRMENCNNPTLATVSCTTDETRSAIYYDATHGKSNAPEGLPPLQMGSSAAPARLWRRGLHLTNRTK